MQTEKSFEHVTSRQGVQLAHKAKENGVLRKKIKDFLDNLKKLQEFFYSLMPKNLGWYEKLRIEAEKIGARIDIVQVVVDYTKNHNEAAMAGGPQTESSWDVLKVGNKYQLPEKNMAYDIIVLLNYPKGGGNYTKTVEWGIKNGLKKTNPHEVFAVGEHFPILNYKIGPNLMYVVETTGCFFDGRASACYVYWSDAERMSSLSWLSHFGGGSGWFAFRKKISPKDLEISVS
jgi:hypothetical protein